MTTPASKRTTCCSHGDTLGFRGDAPVDGTETVAELYAEAIVPLAQNAAWADYLGLELGGRYSEYDNAGGVWTYKARRRVAAKWEPPLSRHASTKRPRPE